MGILFCCRIETEGRPEVEGFKDKVNILKSADGLACYYEPCIDGKFGDGADACVEVPFEGDGRSVKVLLWKDGYVWEESEWKNFSYGETYNVYVYLDGKDLYGLVEDSNGNNLIDIHLANYIDYLEEIYYCTEVWKDQDGDGVNEYTQCSGVEFGPAELCDIEFAMIKKNGKWQNNTYNFTTTCSTPFYLGKDDEQHYTVKVG